MFLALGGLVGSSQGDSTQIGNRPDEPEEQETSDEEGSASESEESEAEGEFKGGKGDLLTSRYQIEKEVGRGTFGRVFRCIDKKAPDSGTNKVAIKVVHNAGRYYELSLIEADFQWCLKYFLHDGRSFVLGEPPGPSPTGKPARLNVAGRKPQNVEPKQGLVVRINPNAH